MSQTKKRIPVEQSVSKRMKSVRSKDTKPEMMIRRSLHALGFRYRLHVKHLPGTPDIVFPGRKKLVFVNGCFWHSHLDCKYGHPPKKNTEFWTEKLSRNVARDKNVRILLSDLGWEHFTIWECEAKASGGATPELLAFLRSPKLPHKRKGDSLDCSI